MRVGILGSGDVGKSFAKAFIALGNDVRIGSRSPEKLADFGSSAATFKDAALFGEIVVLATHGMATENAIITAAPPSAFAANSRTFPPKSKVSR